MKTAGRRERSVFAVFTADVLLAAFIVLTFAFFHHVLPAIKSRADAAVSQAAKEAAALQEAFEADHNQAVEETADAPFLPSAPPSADPTEQTAAVTPEPTPDNRTPWQIKFEDYFTDETVITDHSYSSPNVSVNIDTVSTDDGTKKIVYHVADIHVASIDCFRTYVSHGAYNYFDTQEITEMDAAVDSIISIGGDFCTYQQTGFLVRNGEVCRNDEAWCDICVLYEDGTMECKRHYEYTNEAVMAKGALQVWNFGPSLFDSDGNARNDFYLDVSQTVRYSNPRSAIGYYEPGHYCFVVVDGRQEGYSDGMLLDELAALFHDLGCKCAYNLDGGGSAVMTFCQNKYSSQSNGADRALGDILYICEPEG